MNSSEAQIALNDHSSLFREPKENPDGASAAAMTRSSAQIPAQITSVLLSAGHDSDSDSDLSLEDDQSGSYASSHSSDSEEEEGPLPPEECWENMAAGVARRHGKDAPLNETEAEEVLKSDRLNVCLPQTPA